MPSTPCAVAVCWSRMYLETFLFRFSKPRCQIARALSAIWSPRSALGYCVDALHGCTGKSVPYPEDQLVREAQLNRIAGYGAGEDFKLPWPMQLFWPCHPLDSLGLIPFTPIQLLRPSSPPSASRRRRLFLFLNPTLEIQLIRTCISYCNHRAYYSLLYREC